MTKKSSSILMFLMGLFTWTRVNVIGMIGLAELPCLLIAPILFFQDLSQMRRDRVATLCWLWLVVCAGCLVSSLYNHSAFFQWIRGLATPLVSFSMVVVSYHLMKDNPDSIRWFLLGWSFTGIFTFVVHGGNLAAFALDESGDSMRDVMKMYLFAPLVLIPVRCWYTKIPALLSVVTLLVYGLYVAVATASGRSMALIIWGGAALIFIGQKSIRKMRRIRKGFWFYVLISIVLIFGAKALYSHAAQAGWMGEAARLKYEQQTRGGDSMLKLLMGGRIQFFAGGYCALKQPIMGYGPWPLDWNHVYEEFLVKYGNDDDAEAYERGLQRKGGVGEIPSHSHIVGFWTWYGVAGLILWLYVLGLIVQYFRKYIDVVPQWFGIFATFAPMMLWNIFFSPYAERGQTGVFMCALLLARSYANGWRRMPMDLVRERQKYTK